MEKYKLQQRLGKGAQGSVFLAHHKAENKQYVVKKVECEDETEANQAFKEAIALQNLSSHPFICGYKEFFVTWDREESAMYVCIVMEHYEMGDLSKILKEKRKKKEKIEEIVLKKWFGQMLEALIFVHEYQPKVIHRDLKPSNIFMTQDLSVRIGDFGVSTVMEDTRTRQRTTVGSMHWMAPEVLDGIYDERSDIWSLGCILLEMATCGELDSQEIAGQLCEIKTDPQKLEEMLQSISKVYSPELCQVIRAMLRHSYHQRDTGRKLLDLPYVVNCFELNDSKLVKRSSVLSSVSEAVEDVPKNKGVPGILEYMKNKKHQCNAASQLAALKELLQQAHQEPLKLTNKDVVFISENMRAHISSEDVQAASCQLLNVLAANDDEALWSQEVIPPVVLAMKSHAGDTNLQVSATQLLMTLSANEKSAVTIGKLGGVQDVLAALRMFPDDVTIATNCLGALWSLAVDEGNAKILIQERGLQDVVTAMNRFPDSIDLVESACSALWSLSIEEENIELMMDLEVIPSLMSALRKHKKEARCVKNAFMALASIVENDEQSAYLVMGEDEEQVPGITILIDAFTENVSNEEVVENFSECISALATYDDVLVELKSRNVKDLLKDVKLKVSGNDDLIDAVNGALESLGESSGPRGPRPASSRSRSTNK